MSVKAITQYWPLSFNHKRFDHGANLAKGAATAVSQCQYDKEHRCSSEAVLVHSAKYTFLKLLNIALYIKAPKIFGAHDIQAIQ